MTSDEPNTPPPPPEILFAQHLASNEKVQRDRALRRLKKYLFNHSSLPNGGFNETELLKIWKGLHYCMWMQDKLLIQEELSDNISNLVHSFNNPNTALLFLTTYYMTECREWTSIDKWRMDKFLMLLRNMLTQSFSFLKKKNWSDKFVKQFLGFLSKYILHDHTHTTSPDGIRFHLADIYLTELQKVSTGQLGPKQTVTFLEPWILMLQGINCKTLRAYVIKNVFGELIQQSPVMLGHPRKKGSTKLRVNYRMVADKLLDAGGSDSCLSVNRPAIYNLVQNFRDIAEGKLPYADESQSEEEEVPKLDDDDIENAVQRLSEFTEKLQQDNRVEKARLRMRKRKGVDGMEFNDDEGLDEDLDNGEGLGSDTDMQQEAEPVAKEPAPKKEKKENSAKKGVLSKRLKKSLQNEEKYMAEDSDTEEPVDDEGDEQEELPTSSIGIEEKKSRKKPAKNPESNQGPDKKSSKAAQGKEKPGSKKRPAAPVKPHDSVNPVGQVKRVGKRKKTTTKTEALTPEFDLEEFPDTEPTNEMDLTHLIPTVVEPFIENSTMSKSPKGKRKSNTAMLNNVHNTTDVTPKARPDKEMEGFAEYVNDSQAKAKYFKKSMSKSDLPGTPDGQAPSPTKTPVTRSQTKRLSFGKNSSVKKSAVKLRGSSCYDPTKTPEQGILKVNPIEPGTVIQVGKQATLKNTLKNSKFPHRMMAMNFC